MCEGARSDGTAAYSEVCMCNNDDHDQVQGHDFGAISVQNAADMCKHGAESPLLGKAGLFWRFLAGNMALTCSKK